MCAEAEPDMSSLFVVVFRRSDEWPLEMWHNERALLLMWTANCYD